MGFVRVFLVVFFFRPQLKHGLSLCLSLSHSTQQYSPLTLRNMASIASAYEWSKNQTAGSRSSSSKGTVCGGCGCRCVGG